MNFDDVVNALQNLCEVPLNGSDENFRLILPRAFEYANNRIYREMDFLATKTSQTTGLTANNRNLALPASVITLEAVNVITPVGASADAGYRNPVERVSVEANDFFWPQASLTPGLPVKYSLIGTSVQGFTVRFYPAPDQAYNAELIGIIRPSPIAPPGSTTTYLTTTYPDLWIAACMVFLMGYQRDFGAQSDDPARAMSWEGQYKTLREGVMVEAGRQKGEGAQWTSFAPSPLANMPRERAPDAAR